MYEVLNKLLNFLSIIFAIVFLIVGCSSKTSTKYTESDIRLIPAPSYRNIFKPGRLLIVKTEDQEMLLRVTHYEDNDYFTGQVEGQNNEIKIPINELKEIGIVKEEVPKSKYKKAKTKTSTESKVPVGEALAETLTYLPLTPLLVTAPVIIPMTKSMEARWDKNDLIYAGMTKDELRFYIGEPKGEYQCFTTYGNIVIEDEVWEYSKEQVLPGADLMFFRPGEQKVYHTTGKGGITDDYWKAQWNCYVKEKGNEAYWKRRLNR